MKNRAKCKLCEEVIESFHRHDYVTCKCGHISVDGGNDYFRCAAKDWDNFLRIDDEGNVIVPKVKVKDEPEVDAADLVKDIDKKELAYQLLCDAIMSTENMPQVAMSSAVTHYDLLSFMYLVREIIKEKNDDKS